MNLGLLLERESEPRQKMEDMSQAMEGVGLPTLYTSSIPALTTTFRWGREHLCFRV